MSEEKDQYSKKKPKMIIATSRSSSDTDEDEVSISESQLQTPLRYPSKHHSSKESLSKENSKKGGTNPIFAYSPKKLFLSRYTEERKTGSSFAEENTAKTKNRGFRYESSSETLRLPFCNIFETADVEKPGINELEEAEKVKCSVYNPVDINRSSSAEEGIANDDFEDRSPLASVIRQKNQYYERVELEKAGKVKRSFSFCTESEKLKRSDNIDRSSATLKKIANADSKGGIRVSVIKHTDDLKNIKEIEKETRSFLVSNDDLNVTGLLESSTSDTGDDDFVHAEPNLKDLRNIPFSVNPTEKKNRGKTKELKNGNNSHHISQDNFAAPGPSRLPSCNVCYQEFDDQYLLDQHYASHHLRKKSGSRDISEDNSNAKISPNRRVSVNKEELEHKSDNSKNSSFLRRNLKRHCPNPDNKETFACQNCGRTYVYEKSLRNHEKYCVISEVPYECDQFGEDRTYKCDKCSNIFKTKHNLKEHYRIHTGEKPYTCEKCKMSFNQSSNLKQHQKGCGVEDRPHQCEFCHKSYRKKPDLNVHVRIHTGEKPYECKKCGNRFRSRRLLKNHRKKCNPSDMRE